MSLFHFTRNLPMNEGSNSDLVKRLKKNSLNMVSSSSILKRSEINNNVRDLDPEAQKIELERYNKIQKSYSMKTEYDRISRLQSGYYITNPLLDKNGMYDQPTVATLLSKLPNRINAKSKPILPSQFSRYQFVVDRAYANRSDGVTKSFLGLIDMPNDVLYTISKTQSSISPAQLKNLLDQIYVYDKFIMFEYNLDNTYNEIVNVITDEKDGLTDFDDKLKEIQNPQDKTVIMPMSVTDGMKKPDVMKLPDDEQVDLVDDAKQNAYESIYSGLKISDTALKTKLAELAPKISADRLADVGKYVVETQNEYDNLIKSADKPPVATIPVRSQDFPKEADRDPIYWKSVGDKLSVDSYDKIKKMFRYGSDLKSFLSDLFSVYSTDYKLITKATIHLYKNDDTKQAFTDQRIVQPDKMTQVTLDAIKIKGRDKIINKISTQTNKKIKEMYKSVLEVYPELIITPSDKSYIRNKIEKLIK